MADKIPAALTPTENLTPEQVEQMPTHLGNTPIASTTGTVDGSLLPLYDHKNKTVLNVPHEEAEAYLKSGQFTLPKKTRLNIIDPNTGEAHSIDGAEAYNALQSGYRLERAEETRERHLQDKYGGVGQGAIAALEGFGRGALTGASDQLLKMDPNVTQEDLAGREEANPIISTVSEGAGLVLSPLAKILGVEAAAAKTESFIAKQAVKAGLSNPVAKSIATKIIPHAAGSAVEGAFYGGGQLLSEEALGKADLNAENLAAYIGTGALLNGAFGATFAGAKELAGPVSKVAKYVASPFTSKISQNLDSEVSSARLLGLTPAQLQKLQKRNPKVVEEMQDFLRQDLKLGIADSAEDLVAKNAAVKESAGNEIGAVLKEVDQTLEQMPLFKPSSASVWDNVYNKVYTEVEDALAKDIPGMGKYQKPINDFLDDVARLGKSEQKFSASDLQKFKKGLDKLIKYEKDPGKFSVLEEMAFSARTAVRDEIDKLAQSMETLGGADDLAQRLREANRKYAGSATFGEFLEKRALKSADRDFSMTGTVKDVGLDLSRKLVVLGKIEQGRMKMDKLVQGTVKAFGNTTKGLSIAAQTQVPNIVNSALAVNYGGEKPKKPQTKQEAYNNILQNVNSYTANPTAFMERSNRQTASLYTAAPQTSAQLDNLAMTAMAYLSTKVPKKTQNTTLLSPFQPVSLPSTQDLAKFARILHAIEKPAVVLHNLQNGTASREEIDVLKEVYPATFQKLQETFVHELPKLQGTMPYNRRVQLGILLGVPADQSMQPENVLGLQALFGQAQQQQGSPAQGAVNSTVGGMKELSKSENQMTPLQEAQAGIESE